jgi:hypothetical protein
VVDPPLDVFDRLSGVSLVPPAIEIFGGRPNRRAEVAEDAIALTAANDLAIRRALEAAGIEFIDENGGGPGVRLRKPHKRRT